MRHCKRWQPTDWFAPADLASLHDIAATTAKATGAGRLVEAVAHNREFHRRIALLADSALALRTLDRIWDQIQVSTLQSLTPHARPARVSAQHDELVAAITAGRVQEAGKLARQHVLDTRTSTEQRG